MSDSNNSAHQCDAIVVGAGFAGMYMLHKLRGLGLSVKVFETGSGVGGTWFWNRYPGARCDVDSLEYSYQFSEELQQDWHWPERYSAQPDILEYANHVAERFDLRKDIQFNTRVESAIYNESSKGWDVTTSDGKRQSAQFCIMATGCLSSTNTPDFKGLDSFKGDTYHTGNWPHKAVDFRGKRVGIIGTGSSAIQAIPEIAKQAEQLYVFQRTPNYTVPSNNTPMNKETEARVKADYIGFRERNSKMPAGAGADSGRQTDRSVSALDVSHEQRTQEYESRWETAGLSIGGSYGDLMLNQKSNDTIAEFARGKIRQIVEDPTTAEALCPEQTFACKRLCVDTGYYQTFNQPHVTLVDISKGAIDQITPAGLEANGDDFELDCIIFATGFDAMTGALLSADIRGEGGLTLTEKWSAGPRTYLGLGTSGFPNLFTITGPGSPSVLTNMIPSIEQHVNWIADCIQYMKDSNLSTINVTDDAENSWVEHVNELASHTLYPSCNSWYLGANVPGKPRVFMPHIGFPAYVEKCNTVAANGYQGFALA